MKFNIEQLEKLACLKLNNEQKEHISSSVEDIIGMLKSVEEESVENIDSIKPTKTPFREQHFNSPSKEGLNVTNEGYFLAPKTIKKD